MIPYIVKGAITVTPYMGDAYTIEDMRIVMANDTAEAYIKYRAYWEDRSEEYDIYYRVDCEVIETLL